MANGKRETFLNLDERYTLWLKLSTASLFGTVWFTLLFFLQNNRPWIQLLLNRYPVPTNWPVIQYWLATASYRALQSLLEQSRFKGTLAAAIVGFGMPWALDLVLRRLFLYYDHTVLTLIEKARPFDPFFGLGLGTGKDEGIHALPWVDPAAGDGHFAAWSLLRSFTTENLSSGRYNAIIRPTAEEFYDFRFTILTGRSGAGKTRMAIEFFRDQLAQEHRLSRLSPTRRKYAALGAWFRRVAPFIAPRSNDPWHVGWVNRQHTSTRSQWGDRGQIPEHLLDKLRNKWEPARPTALLLDDPLPGEAQSIRAALEAGSPRFRFPVRLLIISQAIPSELGIKDNTSTQSNDKSGETENKHDFYWGRIIKLDETARLSFDQIHRLASRTHSASGMQHLPDFKKAVMAIDEATGGNPMLVELALRLLGRLSLKDPALREKLNPENLIRERAQRIISALTSEAKKNNYDSEKIDRALRWLACSTLQGPHRPNESLSKRDSEPYTPSEREKLRPYIDHDFHHCFNLDPENSNAVRPELVGDAFVRIVLENPSCDKITARQLLSDAWREYPDGVRKTIRRAAARIDKLGELLREGPPTDAQITQSQLALDYAAAAVLPGFMVQPPADSAEAILSTVCRHIDKLDPTEASAVKVELKKMLEVDQQLFRVQREAALVCILRTISRVTGPSLGQDADAFVRELIDTLEQLLIVWLEMSRQLVGPPPELSLQGVRIRSVEAAEDLYREIDVANLQSLDGEGVEHAVLYASAWRWLTEVWCLNESLARCEKTGEEVRRRAEKLGDPRLLVLEMRCYGEILANRWVNTGHEVQLLEAAERMDLLWAKIGKGFEWNGISADLARSDIWEKVSFFQIRKNNMEGAEKALNKVWQTMEGKKLTKQVAQNLVCATRDNIHIWNSRKNLEKCRVQLSNLENWAGPYESDLHIARTLANGRAIASLTFAEAKDSCTCESIARKVESLAAQYPEDRQLQSYSGAAWVNFWISFETRTIMSKNLGEFTKDWIAPLQRIAALAAKKQFENDLDIQFHSAVALRRLIDLLQHTGLTQEAQRAAENALQICESYKDSEDWGGRFRGIHAKVLALSCPTRDEPEGGS